VTGWVVGGETLLKEITAGVKHSLVPASQVVLESHRQLADEMLPRVQQVIRESKARIFHGDSRSDGKIVNFFEVSAEVIRKSLPPRKC
jgi:IS5 family transposase